MSDLPGDSITPRVYHRFHRGNLRSMLRQPGRTAFHSVIFLLFFAAFANAQYGAGPADSRLPIPILGSWPSSAAKATKRPYDIVDFHAELAMSNSDCVVNITETFTVWPHTPVSFSHVTRPVVIPRSDNKPDISVEFVDFVRTDSSPEDDDRETHADVVYEDYRVLFRISFLPAIVPVPLRLRYSVRNLMRPHGNSDDPTYTVYWDPFGGDASWYRVMREEGARVNVSVPTQSDNFYFTPRSCGFTQIESEDRLEIECAPRSVKPGTLIHVEYQPMNNSVCRWPYGNAITYEILSIVVYALFVLSVAVFCYQCCLPASWRWRSANTYAAYPAAQAQETRPLRPARASTSSNPSSPETAPAEVRPFTYHRSDYVHGGGEYGSV